MGGRGNVERLWELTAEHSPVGMTLVGPDGVVLSANRALCAMLRCDESDLVGSRYELLTHPEDRAAHVRLFDEMLSGSRSSYRLTKRCQRLDGSVVWGDLSAALLHTEAGEPLYVIGQINDVDQQRRREGELAEAVETITRQTRVAQAILDAVDVGLLLIDGDGGYEMFNRRQAEFFALAFPEGHRGRAGQVGDVFAADATTRLEAEECPAERARQGQPFDDYRIWVGADPSRRRALAVSSRPVLDEKGAFAGAALAYSDVTDLMRAIEARDDFLAAASHELRTPLMSVVGYLELIEDDPQLDESLRHQVGVAQRNARRLGLLVADLLESTQRSDTGLVLSRSMIDVGALAREAVEAALPMAGAAGIGVACSQSPRAMAEVDHERVRQVFDNLLTNAVKYTDRGGEVDVRVEVRGGFVAVEVRDSGIGIGIEDLDSLFTPFFRAGAARERHATGVGLGLGICESIVVAHGGWIEVESTVGIGTSMTVMLPAVVEPG